MSKVTKDRIRQIIREEFSEVLTNETATFKPEWSHFSRFENLHALLGELQDVIHHWGDHNESGMTDQELEMVDSLMRELSSMQARLESGV